MELADPGVGVTGLIEFLDEGQILVGHCTGNPHLADGVHRKPHRIGVDHLLQIIPFGFRNGHAGQLFQLGHRPDAGEFVARKQLFEERHEQQLRQIHAVDAQRGPVATADRRQLTDEFAAETAGIAGEAASRRQSHKFRLAVSISDHVAERPTQKRRHTVVVQK